jgi:hypothetical protein
VERLRKFFELPPADRRLWIRAWLWLVVIRLWLWLSPFSGQRGLLSRLSQAPAGGRQADASLPERVGWAIAAASGYVPQTTCLIQALAAQALLKRGGFPARLRLGVGRNAQGQFQAHAWLENDGRVIIGDSEVERYRPLPALDG